MFIYPTIAIATEPIFDIVICSDTTRINPGEKITFNLYFIGIGNITYDEKLFYVDNHITVDSIYVMGKKAEAGLQDNGTNFQRYQNFMQTARLGFINYESNELNPLYGGIFENGEYIPPVKVTLDTTADVARGDHDLKVKYLYKGNVGNWQLAEDTMVFHINTFTEQYGTIIAISSTLIIAIISGLVVNKLKGKNTSNKWKMKK